MKAALLLVAVVAGFGCAASAPLPPVAPQAEPMERANAIVLRTADPLTEAYARMGRILLDRGYSIGHSDETLRVITTDFREASGVGTIRMNSSVFEEGGQTSIALTGEFKTSYNLGRALVGSAAAEDPASRIEKRGMSGSAFDQAWKELEAVARAYPGATLLYARR